jgi:hypothetical protein
MESGALEGIRAELRGLSGRVEGMHTGLGTVRGSIGKHDTEIGVLRIELKNMREDVSEIKDQMKWVLRGLFAAIAVGLMFVAAVAGLILQGAG